MGLISNLPSAVDANVLAILAQMGIDNPSTADQTTIMNFIKVVNDQIGADNPSLKDKTTIMNFLNWLEYLIELKASKNVVGYDSTTLLIPVTAFDTASRAFTSSQTNRLFGVFTSPYNGCMALKMGYNKITDAASAGFKIYEDVDLNIGAGPSFGTIGDYPVALTSGVEIASISLTTIQSAIATIPFTAKAGKRYSLVGTSNDGVSPYTSVQITSLGLYGVFI